MVNDWRDEIGLICKGICNTFIILTIPHIVISLKLEIAGVKFSDEDKRQRDIEW